MAMDKRQTAGGTQLRRLKDFSAMHAPRCVHKAVGMLPYRYTTPSYGVVAGADDKAVVTERSTTGHYLQMYDWDACGNKALQESCQMQNRALREAIEEHLWHEELALYCGYNTADSTTVALRSWTGLTPVIMGIASEERAHRVIWENILNPEHFLRPAGLASHAVSEPLANQQRRGLYGRAIVSNWQGPVWVLPHALIVRALLKYGYHQEAQEIAARVVATLSKGLQETSTLYENYNAETGAPL